MSKLKKVTLKKHYHNCGYARTDIANVSIETNQNKLYVISLWWFV